MSDPKTLISDFLTYLKKERGYSEYTIKAYAYDLKRFASFLTDYFSRPLVDFQSVDRQAIRHFMSREFEQYRYRNGLKILCSGKTVARRLASVKSFFKYLYRTGQINDNPAVYVKSPKITQSLPNFIDYKLIDKLMALPSPESEKGLCDRAMLELFYSTGMRLSELVNLNLQDFNMDNQVVKVRGKGAKERLIPFGNRAKFSLENYLRSRSISFNASWGTQPLFVNSKGKRLSLSTVQRRIRGYVSSIMEGIRLGPHILRHSFATHLMDRGADIRAVKDLLGHSSLSSTQVYTHVQPEKMKKVYHQAHPHGSK
ncbi:MAG: tyrosine recombinase XerC [Fidelibacterota bacterium]